VSIPASCCAEWSSGRHCRFRESVFCRCRSADCVESQRGQKRRALFGAQDNIDSKRDQLIDDMAAKLEQLETRTEVFRIIWTLR